MDIFAHIPIKYCYIMSAVHCQHSEQRYQVDERFSKTTFAPASKFDCITIPGRVLDY